MANCIVSTISALADVIKEEFHYKTLRDLANKKETLMTQISRVGFKLGSKAADYQALAVPEPEPICTNLKQKDFPTGKNTGVNTTIPNKNFLGSCFEIGPGTVDKQAEFAFSNSNGIKINGNLTIRAHTTVTIGKGTNVIINGNLIMEENAKLIIQTTGLLTCEVATLNNNSIITVSTCSIFTTTRH